MTYQLVADIGNTETAFGLLELDGTQVLEQWRVSTKVPRTSDEYKLLLEGLMVSGDYVLGARSGARQSEAGNLITEATARKSTPRITRGVIASVVPSATQTVREAMASVVTGPITVVTAESPLPVKLDVDEPHSVGADRIINTLAAKSRFGCDTIAVDLGTATTFDCITGDGVFLGGVIAPGLSAGLDWLARRTAKLPKVELLPPAEVIGRRTESCIQSGVFYGTVDGLDGIVRRLKQTWSENALVVATGGFSTVVGPHAGTVDRVEPMLTLEGLGIAGAILAE